MSTNNTLQFNFNDKLKLLKDIRHEIKKKKIYFR